MSHQDRKAIRDEFMRQGGAEIVEVIAAVLPHARGKTSAEMETIEEVRRAGVFKALVETADRCEVKCEYDNVLADKKTKEDPDIEKPFFQKLSRIVQHGKFRLALAAIFPDFMEEKHKINIGHVEHALDIVLAHGLAVSRDSKNAYKMADVGTLVSLCGTVQPSRAGIPQSKPQGVVYN